MTSARQRVSHWVLIIKLNQLPREVKMKTKKRRKITRSKTVTHMISRQLNIIKEKGFITHDLLEHGLSFKIPISTYKSILKRKSYDP